MTTPTSILTVLIVEDSAAICTRLIEVLKGIAGLRIIGTAEDEAEAVTLYEKHQPDVAVVDIRLQEGSGIAVLDHIKARDMKCTVIMLTNCIHAEFRHRCEEGGADHFLDKSREFNQVKVILGAILQRRSCSTNED